MYINTDKMVSMTEVNRNFSKVAKMVDDEKMVIIMKNNKPRYVMMDYGEFESIKNSEFRVKDSEDWRYYSNKKVFEIPVEVSPEGNVMIPELVKTKLNTDNNKKVVFREEGDKIILVNSAVYAFEKFQEVMAGKAEEAGISTEEDVNNLIEEIRQELWDEIYADND